MAERKVEPEPAGPLLEALDEEPLNGPPEQGEFTFPADLKSKEPGGQGPQSPIDPVARGAGLDMVIGLISSLDATLVSVTHWDGWAMQPAEEQALRAVLGPLLKSLDLAKWGAAIGLLSLAIIYAGKVTGYLAWRKERAPSVPPARPGAPAPSTPPPETKLGPPMEFGDQGVA